MDSVYFEENEIFEINQTSKNQITGEYTPEALSDKLINEWIPLYECHKCGKGDYCKYAETNPYNSQKKLEIKCGVAKEALKNFISKTFFVIKNSSWIRKQKYLDAAFFYYKYVIDSEQLNGVFINKEKLEWLGDYTKQFFSEIIPIRDTLNELGNCLKEFPELYWKTNIVFVEGETEVAFISNVKGDGNISRAWRFIVESYDGKSNKTPKRIKMLLDDYKTRGYNLYIQGDEDGIGDGSGFDKFKEYVDKKYLDENCIFQFKYDFESSIPHKLLYQALIELGFFENVSLEEFVININPAKSVNDTLKECFSIDTKRNSLKVKIAKIVGKSVFYLNNQNDEAFKKTELGKFVSFLDSII